MRFYMQNAVAPGGVRCVEFGATLGGVDMELGRLVGGHLSPSGSEVQSEELQSVLAAETCDWRDVGVLLGKMLGMRCPWPHVEAGALEHWDPVGFVEGYESGRQYVRRRGIGAVL